jgi:hypothetical protein
VPIRRYREQVGDAVILFVQDRETVMEVTDIAVAHVKG